MRLRIVCPTGRPQDARVENLDTNELLEDVVSVEWRITAGQLSYATIIVNAVPVDVLGETKE